MPRWVRLMQPLFSGVFTVDNLDYVRRDAYMTGVRTVPVDADRLRRYTFVSPGGLALYESGLGALEMFLTARLFMYQTVYFHRTVRAIDLDLAEAFWPAIRAIFGGANPLGALDAYVALDEYALLHQASRWADGHELADRPVPGDGRVTPAVGRLWRGILLRQPRWRAVNEVRRDSRHGGRDEVESLLAAGARRGDRLDLAETDAQPEYARKLEGRLLVARRDGSADAAAMGELLDRLPAVVVVGRAYRRVREARLTMGADVPRRRSGRRCRTCGSSRRPARSRRTATTRPSTSIPACRWGWSFPALDRRGGDHRAAGRGARRAAGAARARAPGCRAGRPASRAR